MFRDEVRLYPRDTRLENSNMIVEDVEGQVLLLNRLGNRCDTSKFYENTKECSRLVVYCANSHISIYEMRGDTGSPSLIKVQDVTAMK